MSDSINGNDTPSTPVQPKTIKIFLLTPGAALLQNREIPEGTTTGFLIQDFAKSQNNSVNNYMLRVNRQPVHGDEVLKDGDRVSITPINGKGGN